eukprot:g2987.t1
MTLRSFFLACLASLAAADIDQFVNEMKAVGEEQANEEAQKAASEMAEQAKKIGMPEQLGLPPMISYVLFFLLFAVFAYLVKSIYDMVEAAEKPKVRYIIIIT